jgi:hypothetical protein
VDAQVAQVFLLGCLLMRGSGVARGAAAPLLWRRRLELLLLLLLVVVQVQRTFLAACCRWC